MATGLTIAFAFVLTVCGLTSCSSADEDAQTDNVRKLRKLSIVNAPLTRVTLSDNGTTLGAFWNEGDVATYINMSMLESASLRYGNLTASEDGNPTMLTGNVYCMAGDLLAVIYPHVTPATGDGTFTISLGGQKGTLADIEDNYHYVYGLGEVTSVTNNEAIGTISDMKPLLAVCKFTFKDEEGNSITVRKLEIGYYDSYSGTSIGYPQSGTVTPADDPTDIEVVPSDPVTPLTIKLATATADGVYVALLPGGEKTEYVDSRLEFTFTVNDIYTGTAKAVLNAGRFYPVTLKMTQSN